MTRPTLLFDGECGFCRDAVARWEREVGDAVEFLPTQQRGERFPQVSDDEAAAAVQWIDGEGRRSGAAAIFAVLSAAGRPRWQAFAQQRAWFLRLSERVYRWVAEHRAFVSRAARRVWGTEREPATHAFTSWLFLRALGVVYLLAFVSLWTQVFGLFGSDGLQPVAETLAQAQARHGLSAFVRVPTVLWALGPTDRVLGAVCATGVFSALLLIQGIASRLCLGLLWVCYLSLVSVGGAFTAYQWDELLLETGLLAILLAPPGVWPRYADAPRPSPVAVFLLRLLLFKLMFLSGVAKVLAEDSAWRNLEALEPHFWTQPLPTTLGIWVGQLPAGVLSAATALVLAIEVGVPFVMFFLREAWARWVVFVAFAGLQVLIALTGNYGFFNLLTLTLCLLVLTDGDLRRFLPKVLSSFFKDRERRATPFWAGLGIALCGILLLTVTFLQMTAATRGRHMLPRPARAVLDAARPLRSCNRYGLFARMTTRRQQIRFEGTQDGATWKSYRLEYADTGPGWVLPGHLPRLDWEMWSATHRMGTLWFDPLAQGLLRGSPSIKALFANDPFPTGPPRNVRIRVQHMQRTADGWKATGRPWFMGGWSRRW